VAVLRARCPRCDDPKPTTDGVYARLKKRYHLCQTCGLKFQSVEIEPRDLAAPRSHEASPARSMPRCRASLEAEAELRAENEPPDERDRDDARAMLKAWEVRRALVRTEKLLEAERQPLGEDLALLERVAATPEGPRLAD